MHRITSSLAVVALVAAAALAPASPAAAQLVPFQQHRNVFTMLNTERCGHGSQEMTKTTIGVEPFESRLIVRDTCPEGRAIAAVAQRSTIDSEAIAAEGAAYTAMTAGGEGLLGTLNISTATFDFQAPADTEIVISGTVSARASANIDLADASLFFGLTHGNPTFVQQARAENTGERITIHFEERMTLEGGLYHLQVAARTIFASPETSAERADAYFNIRVDVVK